MSILMLADELKTKGKKFKYGDHTNDYVFI